MITHAESLRAHKQKWQTVSCSSTLLVTCKELGEGLVTQHPRTATIQFLGSGRDEFAAGGPTVVLGVEGRPGPHVLLLPLLLWELGLLWVLDFLCVTSFLVFALSNFSIPL